MNRIILIGNGFDLAHGLPTSYKDFMYQYWTDRVKDWPANSERSVDKMCKLYINKSGVIKCSLISQLKVEYFKIETKDVVNAILSGSEEFIVHKSPLLEAIDTRIKSYNWVDIEYEYYRMLIRIFKDEHKPYLSPKELDEESTFIKNQLNGYLRELQNDYIKPDRKFNCVSHVMFEPFKSSDISNSARMLFEQFVVARLKYLATNSKYEIDSFLQNYGMSYNYENSNIATHLRHISNTSISEDSLSVELTNIIDNLDTAKHLQMVNNDMVDAPFLLPDNILLLNFNYTNMADLYIPKGSKFKVNHIHGELGNEKNPIIFGYGDELDDDYKEIAKLNDNDYLKNIKSIHYLETDNYRKLLSFIDSAPFQIYIMGHSCGISDRTLLNTLFEHKNCVSIKPFYYQKPDGTDNYIEIVQNISRNFNDMRLMRDRVVNKTYCRPMVEVTARQ